MTFGFGRVKPVPVSLIPLQEWTQWNYSSYT